MRGRRKAHDVRLEALLFLLSDERRQGSCMPWEGAPGGRTTGTAWCLRPSTPRSLHHRTALAPANRRVNGSLLGPGPCCRRQGRVRSEASAQPGLLVWRPGTCLFILRHQPPPPSHPPRHLQPLVRISGTTLPRAPDWCAQSPRDHCADPTPRPERGRYARSAHRHSRAPRRQRHVAQ